MIEDQINSDLKEALLSKNSQKSLTLRQLKSALLYKKVELNNTLKFFKNNILFIG